jgi:hypothetical protein
VKQNPSGLTREIMLNPYSFPMEELNSLNSRKIDLTKKRSSVRDVTFQDAGVATQSGSTLLVDQLARIEAFRTGVSRLNRTCFVSWNMQHVSLKARRNPQEAANQQPILSDLCVPEI